MRIDRMLSIVVILLNRRKIKNDGNHASLFNAFTLLSYTRLAFEYCHYFIEEGEAFNNFDYSLVNYMSETVYDTEPRPLDKLSKIKYSRS